MVNAFMSLREGSLMANVVRLGVAVGACAFRYSFSGYVPFGG